MKFLKHLVLGFLFLGSLAFASESKDWTIYIHMNADNNLCPYATTNMNQLKTGDMSKRANVVVAYDCSSQYDSKLVELQGSKEVVLESGIEYDMGDYRFLTSKAQEVFNRYPSKYKMVVVWNHGSGWKKKSRVFTKGISYDDQSGNHITTVQLGSIGRELQHIDLFGYDACLMQMIEVDYEIAANTDYILGSEETEPGDGWDYTGMVKALIQDKETTPEELGKALVDAYGKYYAGQRVTQSLIKSSALPKLVSELDYLAREFYVRAKEFKTASDSTVSFYYRDYKDIGSLISKLNYKDKEKFMQAYREAVVYNYTGMGSTGLSVYISANPLSSYQDLKFAKETTWSSLLQKLNKVEEDDVVIE